MAEIETIKNKYEPIKLAALTRYELIKEIRSLITTIETQESITELAVKTIEQNKELQQYKTALEQILEFPFLESTEDICHIKRLTAEALGRF